MVTPRSPSNEPLKLALHHLDRNDIAQAELFLQHVLAAAPDDWNALQLLGVIRRAQGRIGEAEELYLRSLAIEPKQPHVHHNLGNLLKAQGRFDEAVLALREAILLKPNYAEAHLALGLVLGLQGKHAEAEQSCRAALRIQPNYIFARQTLAAELNELNRPNEAEKLLRQTLASGLREPRQVAALEHNLGVALRMQHRYREALQWLQSAQIKVPDIPAADYNLGNVLQNMGRLEDAVQHYRRAVARDPFDLFAHADLNKLLYRLGRDGDFLRSYDEAAESHPTAGILPLEKANFLFLKGDYISAFELYQRAAHLLPAHVMPHDGMALILARLNRFEDAIREHQVVVGMEPENALAWGNFAETLLRAGDPEKARAAAEKSLALDPFNQTALAMWGTAARLLKDPEEEWINDCEKLVRVYELRPPDGYASIEEFNRDLNAYLDRLHVDRREFIDQTLRNGTQTIENLFGMGHRLIESLRHGIDGAVADYIAAMADDARHPLMRRRTSRFEYAGSWSARLHDCGFHTNHVHPRGWISSAYYVGVPDAVTNIDEKQGWLKFGEPNFDCRLRDPVRRFLQPESGILVLFPSYLWHGTVPFRSNQSRTTIAFDVVPGSG